MVGVPKTIDNDIPGTDMTFGFDTAVSIATEALDRISTTAESHNRIMVVEVMGRTKGWIATYAGIAAGADAILVPEVEPDLEEVADTIRARHRHGRTYSIVVVAEGCKAPTGELRPCAGRRRLRVRAARGRRVRLRRRARAADRLRDAGHRARPPAAGRHTHARSTASSRRASASPPSTSRRPAGSARWRPSAAARSSACRSPRRAPRSAASTRRCSTSRGRSSASRLARSVRIRLSAAARPSAHSRRSAPGRRRSACRRSQRSPIAPIEVRRRRRRPCGSPASARAGTPATAQPQSVATRITLPV